MRTDQDYRAGMVGIMKGLLINRSTAQQFVTDGIHSEYWQGNIDAINHIIHLFKAMGISEAEIDFTDK